MKLNKLLLASLLFVSLMLFLVQVVIFIYSDNDLFKDEVENQLISSIGIKSERINDYFIENKKNAEVLGKSSEMYSLFENERIYSEEVIFYNLEKRAETISAQLDLFIQRLTNSESYNLVENEEFSDLAIQEIGKNGRTYLVDYSTNEVLLGEAGDYIVEEIISTPTSDGKILAIRFVIDNDDYSMIESLSEVQNNYIDRFFDVFNYSNLFIISSDGNILYEKKSDVNMGQYVLDSQYNEYLGEIHSISKDVQTSFVFGPHKNIGSDEIKIYFSHPMYQSNEFIGVVVLETSMDFVNSIVSERILGSETSRVYLVDSNYYLITPFFIYDILVQKVESENSKNCFSISSSGFNEFESFDGQVVFGAYSKISEIDWCLLSEISYNEIFERPRKENLFQNILYSLIFFILLVLISYIFSYSFNNNLKLKKKINEMKKVSGFWIISIFLIILFLQYVYLDKFLSFENIVSNMILLSLMFSIKVFSRIKKDVARIIITYSFFMLSIVYSISLFLNETFMFGYGNVILSTISLLLILLLFYGFIILGGKK